MKDKFLDIIKKKWLRSIVLTILLVAIIVAIYLAISITIENTYFEDIDLTKEKIYSISKPTEDKLKDLNKDVTLYLFHVQDYVKDFAYKYAKLNEHIKVEEIDNINSRTEWKNTYGVGDSSTFLVASCNGKDKLLNEYDLVTYDYTTQKQIDITEESITNAILNVSVEKEPKVYFLTGHNLYATGYFNSLQQKLKEEANAVEDLDLLTTGKIPEDCQALVITALKEDITTAERDYILDYIKKGGKILLLADPNLNKTSLPNYQQILDEFGVKVSDGVILEGDTTKMLSNMPNFIIANVNYGSSITKNINMEMNICLMNAGKIEIASSEELEKKNVAVENLATLTESAFYRTDLSSSSQSMIESDEKSPSAIVGASFAKKIDDKTTANMIVFANTAFATNTQIQISSQYYMYAVNFYNNEDILLNSLSYLTQRQDTITVRKNVDAVNYTVTEQQNLIILIGIFSIPVLIIIIGIVVWQVRRRKK